jgi:hypothetical protein
MLHTCQPLRYNRSILGGRCAWALLDCDRLLKEFISMVCSQKLIRGLEVAVGSALYGCGDL